MVEGCKHIVLKHNLDPSKFVFLWLKYVTGFNDKKHCTHCLRGKYSRKLSKPNNPDLKNQNIIILDEKPLESYKALYICGVSANGYRQKKNYQHNLHVAIMPKANYQDKLIFENWKLEITNGIFLSIPTAEELSSQYSVLPEVYTSCRIFRWAAGFFLQ